MESVSTTFRRCVRWLRRFRKRCGYGIHSPFAFNLVTGVIYEKGYYYAYEKLNGISAFATDGLRLKDRRLLFRLVNQCAPSTALILGNLSDATLQYMKIARQTATWYTLPSDQCAVSLPKSVSFSHLDFIYIDNTCNLAQLFLQLLPYVTDCTVLVVREPHASLEAFASWKNVIPHQRIRVTFDLYDFGLIYFESRLNKEDYIINYF